MLSQTPQTIWRSFHRVLMRLRDQEHTHTHMYSLESSWNKKQEKFLPVCKNEAKVLRRQVLPSCAGDVIWSQSLFINWKPSPEVSGSGGSLWNLSGQIQRKWLEGQKVPEVFTYLWWKRFVEVHVFMSMFLELITFLFIFFWPQIWLIGLISPCDRPRRY